MDDNVLSFTANIDIMDDENVLSLTAKIVSAHVSRNGVRADQLSTLIKVIHQTLATVGQAVAEPPKAEPAVLAKKSVFPGHIVCMDCGKGFKVLKRHIGADHGLTPGQYRAKWELPPSYPMVAPEYASQRSQLALASGLGKKAPVEPAPKKLAKQSGSGRKVEAPPLPKKRCRPKRS
jgi:predicted transcriptional regulator